MYCVDGGAIHWVLVAIQDGTMITDVYMSADPDKRQSDGGGQPTSDAVSTLNLLERFKRGDEHAVDLLVERSIPPLRRWARGRLPPWARSLVETQDLVQVALVRALPHLKAFEPRHVGALKRTSDKW